jgi:hypothetical protein
MSNQGAFVLPAGVTLSLDGDALSIANPGDIVIEGAPAQRLDRLSSEGGNVTLNLPGAVSLKSISAPSGTVTVGGKVTVDSIEATRVEFTDGTLKAKLIKASEAITIAGKKLEASVLVAPTVDIASDVKGSAMAIQCSNEMGAHKLKGGFSLAEFATMMPGGAELLESFGIEVPDEDDDDDDDDDDDQAAAKGPAPPDEDEPTELAEAGQDDSSGVPEEVSSGIAEALEKIQTAYEGDPPPPVVTLAALVTDGDFASLKVQINSLWSDLLKHHQKSGLYISNTVTHMFQTVQLLLRKLED